MITENTVFILGAGASKPYGYPTGNELRDDICEKFKRFYETHNFRIDTKLLNNDNEIINKIENFSKQFKNSDIISIDKFINMKIGFSEEYYHLGRFAIILTIFYYEKKSLESNYKNWYTELFNEMLRGINKIKDFIKFKDNKICFITFNYDRSLENYFFNKIAETFIKSELNYKTYLNNTETIDDIKSYFRFKIYHVYGKIAELNWENKESNIGYGEKFERPILIDKNKLDNINLIYDNRKNNQQIKIMVEELKEADKIFFLGFGFDEDNLKVLNIPECLNSNQKIYATGYHLLNEQRDQISKIIGLDKFIIEDNDCLTLLKKYLR